MLLCVSGWNNAVVAIVRLVKSGSGEDGKPFRPLNAEVSAGNLSNEEVLRSLMWMMDECWAERELSRPSFDECLDLVYRLTGDK